MLILSTCFYIVKSKFDVNTYVNWFKNLLTNIKKFKLVVYTNTESYNYIYPYCDGNKNIKIVLKDFEKFYNFKYNDNWIENQKNNIYLRDIDWKLQLIWSEKINFVYDTAYLNYHNEDNEDNEDKQQQIWYGWCDIGYFRGRQNDIAIDDISSWPNMDKIHSLNKDRIYYAVVNNDTGYVNNLIQSCLKKNSFGLPETPIQGAQISVAGGFFLSTKNNIGWWKETFDSKIQLYFKHFYLVKDDQMIIINCISENMDKFELITENIKGYDNWFMFQRFLLL